MLFLCKTSTKCLQAAVNVYVYVTVVGAPTARIAKATQTKEENLGTLCK